MTNIKLDHRSTGEPEFNSAGGEEISVSLRCVCVCVYPDLVVYELASHVHLLGGASDGEDPGVGVGRRRRVPLELHVGSRLLVDALDGFSACRDKTAHSGEAPSDTEAAFRTNPTLRHGTRVVELVRSSTCLVTTFASRARNNSVVAAVPVTLRLPIRSLGDVMPT